MGPNGRSVAMDSGDLKCREVKLDFEKEINANRFFWDSHWLEIWKNHLGLSMGPNTTAGLEI
jgi:hypothetical protein